MTVVKSAIPPSAKTERPQPVDADHISVRIEHEADELAGKRIERSNLAAAVISDQ